MENQPLSEQVYQRLRHRIHELEYLPGEILVEARLSEELSTSRTPVREALRRLQSERLVEHRPGSSFRVAKVTQAEVLEAIRIRCELEPLAAELAASRATSEEIEYAEALLSERESYIASKRPESYSAKDYLQVQRMGQAFHNIVLDAARSPLLSFIIINCLWKSWLGGYDSITLEWLQRSVREHRGVLEAITRRDSKEARSAMRLHLKASLDTIEGPTS